MIKKITLIFLFLVLILFIIKCIPKNNAVCEYKVDYEDYSIKYIDKFYYQNETLTKVHHKIIYSNTEKENEGLYDQIKNIYENYTDASPVSKYSGKKLTFEFSLTPEGTSETSYLELIGISKDTVINSYPDDIIKMYIDNYSEATCKMK